jgi:hypothetical protein
VLTDPQIIQPGWVLVLPGDASGPGVRFGPLPPPATAPAPTRSATASAAAGGPPVTLGMVTVVGLCLGLVVGLPLLSSAYHRRGRRARSPAPATPVLAARPGAFG